jgi:tetratricopeptide (TPR) repeat protein
MRRFIRPAFFASIILTLAAPASAQVFVIGNGLGAECYQKTARASGNFIDAETSCTRALREETMNRENRAKTYVNRGVLRMRAGRYDQAIADYDSAVNLQPELGAAWLNRGAALIYQKDFASALPQLNRAIELNSQDLFAAYYNRAIARENTGDVQGAYSDFNKALELRPDWDLAERQLSRFMIKETNG